MSETKQNIPITVDNEQVFAYVEEMLREGTSVKLKVRGNSMAPALMDGKDSVTLEPVAMQKRELSVGDVILFRYNGRFIMHRIVSTYKRGEASDGEGMLITTKGDALTTRETISSKEIIAVAKFKKHSFIKLLARKLRMSRYLRYLQNALKE